jgi:hypothetical protein
MTVAGEGCWPPFRARGDDEALGDVAQAHLLVAEVEGHGQHVVVGDAGVAPCAPTFAPPL